jgi:hypothetical protein
VSELDSLRSRAVELSSKVDFWNNAVLWALLVAALAAAGIVIAQRKAFLRSKELTAVQENISSVAAMEADARIAEAQRGAAEATEKAEGFRLDIAKANERAASANELAQKEAVARLKLEARLSDRVLAPEGQSRLRAMAASFPHGTRIDICVFGGTLEIVNIAEAINKSLTAGGWTVRQWQVTGGGAVRGILVGTEPNADSVVAAVTARAASELIAALLSGGVAAGPWKFEELQVNGMRQGPAEPVDAPIRMFIGSKQ